MIMTFLFFLLSCGNTEEVPTSTDISQFDQTCSVDSDCVAVTNGNLCGCACKNAALNIEDLDAWQAHYDDVYANCDPTYMPDCAACPPMEGYCEAGVCQIRMPAD